MTQRKLYHFLLMVGPWWPCTVVQAQAMPAAVITTAFKGLPHFARTLSALSSFRKEASLLKDIILSLNGLNVGTDVMALIVS